MSNPAKFRNKVKISERHGAKEWATEKVALLILLPLGLWVASTVFTLAGAGHPDVVAWFASPVNAALAALTILIFCGYASLAWKVILEDYIHKIGTRAALIWLLNLAFFALAAASVFFIVRLALGSAPLPAGV